MDHIQCVGYGHWRFRSAASRVHRDRRLQAILWISLTMGCGRLRKFLGHCWNYGQRYHQCPSCIWYASDQQVTYVANTDQISSTSMTHAIPQISPPRVVVESFRRWNPRTLPLARPRLLSELVSLSNTTSPNLLHLFDMLGPGHWRFCNSRAIPFTQSLYRQHSRPCQLTTCLHQLKHPPIWRSMMA